MLRNGNTSSGTVDVAAIAAAVAAELTIPSTDDIQAACELAMGTLGVVTSDGLSNALADLPTAGEVATAVAAPSVATIAAATANIPGLLRVEADTVFAPNTLLTIAGTAGQVIRVYAMHLYSSVGATYQHSGSAITPDMQAQTHVFLHERPLYVMADGASFVVDCNEGGLAAEVWYTKG